MLKEAQHNNFMLSLLFEQMYFQNCFLLKHFTGLRFISKGSDHLNHSNTMISYDVWVIKLGDLILKETACWMCE